MTVNKSGTDLAGLSFFVSKLKEFATFAKIFD